MNSNIDIKTLEITIHKHDAYLNSLIQAKNGAESNEYKKELKKLIKSAKKHSKKLNKLYKEIQLREVPDRILVKDTNKKHKKNKKADKKAEIEVVSADEDTEIILENDETALKSKLTGESTESSKACEMRMILGEIEDEADVNDILEALEAELEAELDAELDIELDEEDDNIEADEVEVSKEPSEIVLESIESDVKITSEKDKLPIDCELNGVNCVFTPQHTLIIKAENKLPVRFIESTAGLSKVTAKNISKALVKEELIRVKNDDNSESYLVLGNLTCSSRLDAMKIILGTEDVKKSKENKEIDFKVGNITLREYLILG